MDRITRRQLFKGAMLGLFTALPSMVAGSDPVSARTKFPKDRVRYQDTPKNGRECSGCRHFLPKENACDIVQGTISPHGWCMMWAPKA